MTDKKKTLSPMEWIELETMWGSGEYTLTDLAEKSGLRPETLSRRFKAKGVTKGSLGMSEVVRTAIQDVAIDKNKQRLDKIEKRRDFYDTTAVFVANMTRKLVADCVRDKKDLSFVEGDLKSLQRASNTLAKCYDVSSKALGMDREEISNDELPELMFGELTAEQVKAIRAAQSGETEFLDEETEALEAEIAEAIAVEREEKTDGGE